MASYGTGKTGFIDTMAGSNVEGVADAVRHQEPNFFAQSGNVEGAEKGAATNDQDPVVIIQDESKLSESMTDKTTDALTTENLSQEQLQLQAQ